MLFKCNLTIFFLVGAIEIGFAGPKTAPSWRSGSDLANLYDRATPNPTGSLSGPYFLQKSGQTITGIRGKTTFLVCSIRNLANYTVSWMRHSDTHPLTIGGYTYTPDSRFTSVHKPSSENWVLEITNTKMSDIGIYECQISTNPIRSLKFNVNVSGCPTTSNLSPTFCGTTTTLRLTQPMKRIPLQKNTILVSITASLQLVPLVLWYYMYIQENAAELYGNTGVSNSNHILITIFSVVVGILLRGLYIERQI